MQCTKSGGGFDVSVAPSQVNGCLGILTLTVKAKSQSALAQLVSFTSNTITLDDGTLFPSSGSGQLRSGTGFVSFSWTGKSGDTLTGASGHGSPSTGASIQSVVQAAGSYAGYASISAQALGKNIGLTKASIVPSDWVGGIATVNTTIIGPTASGVVLTISVEESKVSSTGRSGSSTTNIGDCDSSTTMNFSTARVSGVFDTCRLDTCGSGTMSRTGTMTWSVTFTCPSTGLTHVYSVFCFQGQWRFEHIYANGTSVCCGDTVIASGLTCSGGKPVGTFPFTCTSCLGSTGTYNITLS